jgi:hypothetical protein
MSDIGIKLEKHTDLVSEFNATGVSGALWKDTAPGATLVIGNTTTLDSSANGFYTSGSSSSLSLQSGTIRQPLATHKILLIAKGLVKGAQNVVRYGNNQAEHILVKINNSKIASTINTNEVTFDKNGSSVAGNIGFAAYVDISTPANSFKRDWDVDNVVPFGSDVAGAEVGTFVAPVFTQDMFFTMSTDGTTAWEFIRMYYFTETPSDLSSGINTMFTTGSYTPWG